AGTDAGRRIRQRTFAMNDPDLGKENRFSWQERAAFMPPAPLKAGGPPMGQEGPVHDDGQH
ncbi:MAG: hypothetical protein J5855_05180, partial [Mailhella sp.]|nr:hypothetical protein [Mailhella sp.]